ncbi:hypothetical protein C8F04DRAFT_1100580 [Mycena alexandri]|uniref:Uncharacterized protein n=1 Tax=Mycena alexandri TaxID=1745969 RepID=A0AAD6SV71_9AGAR|nr:hypothetical protein C8F04DRAFT_1100580 [Mycena alexandri]
MSSAEATFTQRAKEWGTTPFIAEWLDNTFIECTNSQGKKNFENWNVTNAILAGTLVMDSVGKKRLDSGDKIAFMWKCVTHKAILNWHQYAAEMNLFQPERTKPAPKRRKGESSSSWMARVNGMKFNDLLDGHKLPNIDLDAARHIAISEYDKTRDTLELWRTDSKLFFSDICARSKSIILSPEILPMDERYKQRHRVDDAMRTRVIFLSMVHLAWKEAAELFEYLAEKGLNTASAIERAYEKDPANALVWRFMAVINITSAVVRKMWANFSQLIASSDHFKPLFKAWRDKTGLAHIDANTAEIQKRMRQGTYSSLDDAVVHCMIEIAPQPKAFFQAVETGLSEDPGKAKLFSAATFEAMGDLAAGTFSPTLTPTPFGNRLMQYAGSLELYTTDRKQMRSIMYFMDPAKLPRTGNEYWDKAGEVSRSTREMEEAWNSAAWGMSIDSLLQFIQTTQGPKGLDEAIVIPVPLFNIMWGHIDTYLWTKAAGLDRKGEEGRVAKAFGLFDPADPKRPMASEFLLRSLDPDLGIPVKAQTTPAPYVQNIPVAGPGDSIVQSGYAFVTGLLGKPAAKEKVKTRGEASTEDGEDSERADELRALPEVLPTEFKIGKKVLKLFHRILEPPEEEKENAPAKGQVRWGDFENAMKRIGFEVVQTAGSSVRFDPPASTARPITFHRPHPDSLLTPHAIKWVGARLKRTYGWTTETFARGAGDEAS